MSNDKTEYTAAEVKHKITPDFVIDMYEKAMSEPDPTKQEALLETVKVLSENIDEYLVASTNDIIDRKNK